MRAHHRAGARRTIAGVTTILLSLLTLVGVGTATASCHVAGIEPAESEVVEGPSASITLRIHLVGGQPTCAGTVDWAVSSGTAMVGQDVLDLRGTAEFVADDDREELITITVVDDDVDEPEEQFTVVLSNPTGGIGGVSEPAIVTIVDDDAIPTSEEPASAPPVDLDELAAEQDSGSPWAIIAIAVISVAIMIGGGMFFRSRQRE